MRKLVAVGCILVLFCSVVVAAETYAVPLETEDGERDFMVEGSYDVVFEDAQVVLEMTFRPQLVNTDINSTEIKEFNVYVKKPGGNTSAKREFEEVQKTEDGDWFIGWQRFEPDVPIGDIDYLLFEMTHRASIDGAFETRQVAKRQVFEFDVSPNVTGFETNMSTVSRGEKLYVNGSVEDIGRINFSDGPSVAVKDETFSGWVRVPQDIEEGMRTVPVVMRTGRGDTFERSVTVEVTNSPPRISVSHPDMLEKGKVFKANVTVSDDTGIRETRVLFQGEEVPMTEGVVAISTNGLPTDDHPVSFTATDVDGETTSKTVSFELLTAEEIRQRQQDQNGQDGGEEYGQGTSTLVSIVTGIQDVIRGLLGM